MNTQQKVISVLISLLTSKNTFPLFIIYLTLVWTVGIARTIAYYTKTNVKGTVNVFSSDPQFQALNILDLQ